MPAPARIESLNLRGFRSLADVAIPHLPQAAVLIGANGSGKSNLIRFFALMRWMLLSPRGLGYLIAEWGGADDQLFGGSERTQLMESELGIRVGVERLDYKFGLAYADPDRMIFAEEAFRVRNERSAANADWRYLGSGHTEAKIVEAAKPGARDAARVVADESAKKIVDTFRSMLPYDTADVLSLRNRKNVQDNERLYSRSDNLPSILYRLEQEDIRRYEDICAHIGRVLPGFDHFVIEESAGKVQLRWKAKWSGKTFAAHLTSTGSLRFFSLITLLNLPHDMLPEVLLIDEPELGLHPSAVTLIGSMIKSLAAERQVIVATQSPLLVDAFGVDEILALDLHEGKTSIRTLNPDDYQAWLEDYSTGDLWRKNVFGGRP